MDEFISAMQYRRLPPLAALRAFEAAARHLSFKRAAKELGVTPTAISHQIRLLEETLKLPLFERQTRSVALTPAGQQLYPVLRDGFDAFARTLHSLVAPPRRRSLTLSVTPAFAAKWLLPRIPSWRAAQPEIDLHLHASEEPVDLISGSADVAIRYGYGPFPGLHAEVLLEDRFAPVASPHLGLKAAADLRRHTLLHFDWRKLKRDTPTWRLWAAKAGLADLQVENGIRFSDESHAIQAAIAGQGVALLSLILVAEELASGALVQPFGPVVDGYRYQLAYPAAVSDGPEIAALRKWLQEAASGKKLTS
jgi:LysR family glycine cleavage system transcriptional activator